MTTYTMNRSTDLFLLSVGQNAAMKPMKEPPPGLPYRIWELRMARGFARQEDLAEAAGVAQSSISDIERGVTTAPNVKASTLAGISRALNTTWEYLLEGAHVDPEREQQEAELVSIYRQIQPQAREAILMSARTVLAAQPTTTAPEPTAADGARFAARAKDKMRKQVATKATKSIKRTA